MVHDGIAWNGRVIELQEREAGRIRAPPVGAELAAAVDLLLVHPIELAVEDVGAAVGGNRTLVRGRGLGHEEVVAAHEGHEPAVGAERGQFLCAWRAGETRDASGAEVVDEQIVRQRQEYGCLRGIERQTARTPDDGGRVFTRDTGNGGESGGHPLRVEERLRTAV